MKKIILTLGITLQLFLGNAQVTISPDTLKIGTTNQVIFSGSGINFSQGTCIYVFLVQGTEVIYQNASSTYQAGSNILSASFTIASSMAQGLWDIYIVDICSGSWTGNVLTSPSSVVTTFLKKMTIRTSSAIQSIMSYFDFVVFPNPVKDQQITVKSTQPTLMKNIVNIRDLQGKSILTTEYRGEESTINTSKLSAGIYFVEIFNELGQKRTKKILVE